MNATTQTPARAIALLKSRPLSLLLNDWEATNTIKDDCTPMVRGWIMDELESRNPEAFNAWLEGPPELEPRAYFLPA